MGNLKDSFKRNTFDEDAMFVRIRNQNAAVYKTVRIRRLAGLISGLAVAVLFILIISIQMMGPIIRNTRLVTIRPTAPDIQKIRLQAYAMVSIDINPSFEVYIDANGHVLEIYPVNADAEKLDLSNLFGKQVDETIRTIIRLAAEARFIQTDDQAEDYVLISTVILDENGMNSDAEQEKLENLLVDCLDEDDGLNESITIAVIKSSLREKIASDHEDMPLGLFIINEMDKSDRQTVSVKEFLALSENLNKLSERAVIIRTMDEDQQEDDKDSEINEDHEQEEKNDEGIKEQSIQTGKVRMTTVPSEPAKVTTKPSVSSTLPTGRTEATTIPTTEDHDQEDETDEEVKGDD